MAEISSPTRQTSLLLVLFGAAVVFWLHNSASAQPSAAPAAAPTPIVISQAPAAPAAPAPVINLRVESAPSSGGSPGRGATPVAVTSAGPTAVAVSAPTTSIPAPVQTTHQVVHDYTVSVNGSNVVVAQDGSIVQVGDNGQLNGNTGDSTAGGSIGVDVVDSTIQPGTPRPASTQNTASSTGGTQTQPETRAASTGATEPAPQTLLASTGATEPATQARTASTGSAVHAQLPFAPTAGAATSISGYEDHSIGVDGDDNLVTYDDSAVFVNRNGKINANTGDTDSSGLNVVDAVDSVVRSGNSGDGEGSEDDDDEAEGPATGADSDDDGDDQAELEDASTLEDADAIRTTSAPASTGGASASVDDEDVSTGASGNGAFVIGGDGFDDLAIRVSGSRNIVTYDDGYTLVGGTGDVNAQIGDSDTAGAVVMGVRGSLIEAGCEGDLCPLYSRPQLRP